MHPVIIYGSEDLVEARAVSFASESVTVDGIEHLMFGLRLELVQKCATRRAE